MATDGAGSKNYPGVKRRRVQILDYFCMIQSNADKCQAQTDEARRDSIRAVCNICHKTISGTYRVKSNFITHLRKSHHEAYMDYQIKTGRHSFGDSSTLSIASLDEPSLSVIGMMKHKAQLTSNNIGGAQMMSAGAESFGSLIPRHQPTSTVRDLSSADGLIPSNVLTENSVIPVKAEPDGGDASALSRQTSHQHTVREALLDVLIGDLLPLRIVESSRFSRFLQLLNPHYQLPPKEEIQRLIGMKATAHKNNLADQLQSIDFVCVSWDLWQTISPKHQLVTFSVHFFENWTYKHIMISTHQVNVEPGEDKDNSVEIKRRWDELEKATLTNMPATTVVLAAVSNQMTKLQIPGYMKADTTTDDIMSEPFGQSSYASLLDQVVVSSLILCGAERCAEGIRKAGQLLHTPGVEWEHDVSQVSEQPWYEQLRFINMVLCMDNSMKEQIAENDADCLLDDSQILALSKIVEVLRPFQEVAERIRSTNSVTCSLAFASIKLLKAALRDFETAYPGFQLIEHLKAQLLSFTKTIDCGKENVYTTATILDPRFKLQWCEAENQEYFKKSFVQVAKDAEVAKSEVTTEPEVKDVPFQSSGGFFTRILKQQPESAQVGTITSEVLRYLDEPLMLEDCDVIGYWQANEKNFPHLSILAQRYLAIPTCASHLNGLYDVGEQIRGMQLEFQSDVLQQCIELRLGMDI